MFTSTRGSIATWNQTLIPTTREAPNDAESPSHILLSRAGYIRKLSAGIYDYLPLAQRVLKKIAAIVREEMDASGASELLLPCLLPVDLYKGTKRDVDYGDLLFKLTDRKDGSYALGPTHEEPITELVMGSIQSYKQLPVSLYQIQTKFRDEARPRSGLLRCREFIMKDAYSFHMNVEGPGGLNETYDKMFQAYSNVFARCGLSFTAVEAESGPIGGSASHEFMVNAESGEDTILKCPVTGYAANVEKCEIGLRATPRSGYFAGDPSGTLEEIHTPNCPGIEDVAKLTKVKPVNMIKTVVFQPDLTADQAAAQAVKFVVAVVRGDHDVNEGKARDLAGMKLKLADAPAARAAGFEIGYVSPRAAIDKPGVVLLIDRDVAIGFDDAKGKSCFWMTGGDKKDFHVKHFNWQRDLGTDPVKAMAERVTVFKVGDVRNGMVGDPSPKSPGAVLEAAKGIEVGHIFKLGTKYSEAMGFAIMDDQQVKRAVIMGCYGIGVSRTMASSVEQNHDVDGIVWPAAIAPFHVLITIMKPELAEHVALAYTLADQLAARSIDVLIDDREERAGVKFKDADLIGIPLRLTLGDKGLAAGAVEFKLRRDRNSKGELCPVAEVADWCVTALRASKPLLPNVKPS